MMEKDFYEKFLVYSQKRPQTNFGSSHGMRNELQLSNEVALDGLSWHVCCFDEEVSPCGLQASDYVRKGVL